MSTYFAYAALVTGLTALVGLWFHRVLLKNSNWWFFVPLIYGYLWNQTSLVALERGFFITEQGTVSEFSGAALRYWIFFCFVLLGFISSCPKDHPGGPLFHSGQFNRQTARALIIACAIVTFSLAANAALSPSGWSGGIDRFNWWENSRFPGLRQLTGEVCWPVTYGVGICFAIGAGSNDRFLRWSSAICVIAYLFFLFRMGQKYNGFIPPLFALSIPTLILFRVRPSFTNYSLSQARAARRLLFAVGVAAGFLLVMASSWFALNWQNSRMAMGPLENLAYRVFILQAHTYYGADYMHFQERFPSSEALRELRDNNFESIPTVMKLIGDQDLVQDYQTRGVRFATIHPAISILAGGIPLATLTSFVIGAIAGLGSRFFLLGTTSRSILLQYSGVSLGLFAYGLFMMSDLSSVLSLKFLLPLSMGVAIITLPKPPTAIRSQPLPLPNRARLGS